MSSLSLTTLTVVTPMVLAICITAWPTALLAPFCRTQSPGLRLIKSFNILQRTKCRSLLLVQAASSPVRSARVDQHRGSSEDRDIITDFDPILFMYVIYLCTSYSISDHLIIGHDMTPPGADHGPGRDDRDPGLSSPSSSPTDNISATPSPPPVAGRGGRMG